MLNSALYSLSPMSCAWWWRKKKITPISMELSTRRYSQWRPGGAKDIPDGHETIDTHYHHVREQLEAGTFDLMYVPTEDNLADLFTKNLPKPRHHELAEKIRCV